MLEISGLCRRFGELVALDGVSLSVERGEIVGLVGRNGAGKTTLMRSVMGILEPQRGPISWDGNPVGERDRLGFGYMPEERGLYAQMGWPPRWPTSRDCTGWNEPRRHARRTTGSSGSDSASGATRS